MIAVRALNLLAARDALFVGNIDEAMTQLTAALPFTGDPWEEVRRAAESEPVIDDPAP